MIDLINHEQMSNAQRRESLFRAIHSQPFWTLLEFEIITNDFKTYLYAAKANVDKDYWITEVKANFGETFVNVGSLFEMSLWTSNTGDSLYHWTKGLMLPTAFQATEARQVAANTLFDDKQRELMPRLVRAGNAIQANIKNLGAKSDTATTKLVISGYYTLESEVLDSFTTQGINESLAQEIRYETWKINVNTEGQKSVILDNDRYARLVLGFGIIIPDTSNANNCTVYITDNYRSLRLMNERLPVEFIAPKLPIVDDISKYLLPLEYLFKPFASLKFEFVNDSDEFEFVMFTRTV